MAKGRVPELKFLKQGTTQATGSSEVQNSSSLNLTAAQMAFPVCLVSFPRNMI